MNKKLLTAVVGAALVAGPLAALAAGPTVFGNVHISLDRIENGAGTGSADAIEQGFMSSNNSDFGIRGEDDLGGGMKAIYQVRAGAYSADTGASGFGGTLQDTFVGLSGAFGTVKFGKLDTPFKGARGPVEGLGSRVGDMRNLIGGTTAGTGTLVWNGVTVTNFALSTAGTFDARWDNSVRYDSPKLGGVVVTAQYGASENTTPFSGTSNDGVSVGALWTGGPLTIGGFYEKHQTAPVTSGSCGSSSDFCGEEDETGLRIVARFAQGPFGVGALFERLEAMKGIDSMDRDAIAFSGWYKFGNSTVRGQYTMLDDVEDLNDTGAKMLSISLDHALSKATTAYVIYATVDNDLQAAFKVSGAGAHGNSLSAVTGEKQSGLSAGLQVKF